MPLMKCPDCNKEISTSAPVCPHCGRPVAKIRKAEETAKATAEAEKQAKKNIAGCLTVFALLSVFIIVATNLPTCEPPTQKTVINQQSQPPVQERAATWDHAYDPEGRLGLPEEQRKELFLSILGAEKEILDLSFRKYPTQFVYTDLPVGYHFKLKRPTPIGFLHPKQKPKIENLEQAFMAIRDLPEIPAGSDTKILEVYDGGLLSHYKVDARTGSETMTGWILSSTLSRQIPFDEKRESRRYEFGKKKWKKKADSFMKQHALTAEQFNLVRTEGEVKNWSETTSIFWQYPVRQYEPKVTP